jgi:hypothetical protein
LDCYRIELRALPDTPSEERHAIQGPQTVYYILCARSSDEAACKAIEFEMMFTHRKEVFFSRSKEEINV